MKAILSPGGVLVGFAADADGPDVPDGCDLAPGHYRWVDQEQAFMPLSWTAPPRDERRRWVNRKERTP